MSVKDEWQMCCPNPKCGKDDMLDIAATVYVRLTADGTDADASETGLGHEWGPQSPVTCGHCGTDTTVKGCEDAFTAEQETRSDA